MISKTFKHNGSLLIQTEEENENNANRNNCGKMIKIDDWNKI